MGNCGYVCPNCEGKGYDNEGKDCNWCKVELKDAKTTEEELLSWIREVHNKSCCGDL